MKCFLRMEDQNLDQISKDLLMGELAGLQMRRRQLVNDIQTLSEELNKITEQIAEGYAVLVNQQNKKEDA